MSETHEVCISVRVMTIRDGTHGISLALPERLIGEWTDSNAGALSVTDKFAVCILGNDGTHRYSITMPGTPLRGEQVSDTEASIVVQL